MGLIKTLGRYAWRKNEVDGDSSSAFHKPQHADIFAFIYEVDSSVEALRASAANIDLLAAGLIAANVDIDALQIAVVAAADGLVRKATWTELAAITGTRAGQPAEATTDAGTHTDPVVGGTVNNKGAYAWSTSPAGWERVGDIIDASTVNAGITAVDGKLDALLAPIAGQQIIGVASPSSGTNASGSTYVHAKEVEADGVLTSVQIYAGVAGVVEVGVFSRSSADLFTRLRYQSVSVSVGLNTIAVRLPAARGNYVGVTVSTAGTLQYITTTNHGYFSGTLSGGAFTDTASSPSLAPQFRFTIDQVGVSEITDVLAGAGAIPQVLGKADAPATGTNAAPGTVVPNNQALSDGVIDKIDLYSGAAATVVIGLYERSGVTMSRVSTLCRVTTSPGVLNTFSINQPIAAGQYIGYQSATGGFIVYANTTGDGYFYGSTTSSDDFDHAAANTAATMQVRATIRRAAKARHTVRLENVDRVLLLGPSYGAGHYNQRGKNWISKVALFSDFTFENFSYSGETIATLLDRIRTGTVNSYAALPPAKMNVGYALICEGWNSANSVTYGATFAEYQADIRQMIETVKALGAVPILASEWQPVYDASAHAVFRALAQEMGVMHINLIPHSLRNAQGTAYADFWRPATGVRHFGVRTNHIVSDQVDRFMRQLGRPKQAIKLFRKRLGITVADIDDDLMFIDLYERAERFREIYVNQVALTEATENYYDELVSGSASYDPNSVVQSEYLTLQNAGAVAFSDYALLEVVLDAVPRNVEMFRLTLSDPSVTVWVKDALAGGTYPSDGVSVCRWTALTGSDGVYTLLNRDLPGKMHFDKLSFLIYKSGGFSLSEPRIEWWGDTGKPDYPIALSQTRAAGTELLNVTKFAAISGNKATGWDDVGGTITPSSDATYQLPYDMTHFVTVDATKKVVQTLDYATDNFDDIEVEIVVTARNFPAIFASGGTYASAPITQDTFDWEKVVVELIDPTGAYVFTQSEKVGLWWDEVVFRAILPMRIGPLDIRVSGSAEIQLTKVSVKTLI